MKYRLVVLTHGCYPWLKQTLTSFEENVTPLPHEIVVVADGAVSGDFALQTVKQLGLRHVSEVHTVASASKGFCYATTFGWNIAKKPGVDWVFWLEHDFLFERKLPLRPLADALTANPMVTQMGIMRHAVNAQEIAAGGCYALRRELYTNRGGWLESRTNHSSTCSLMRRQFMVDNPWPAAYEQNCEGRFSIDLLAAGYTFGVWGGGEPWIRHIGERTGHGY